MSDLNEKLERCFQAVFPELTPAELREAKAETAAGWDSAALVTLMSVIEEEFAIAVEPEDLERWTSFPAIRSYLHDRITR